MYYDPDIFPSFSRGVDYGYKQGWRAGMRAGLFHARWLYLIAVAGGAVLGYFA